MRVVSLLPAATDIIAALGAGDTLVAVTHECDAPIAQARPRVTATPIHHGTAAAIDQQVHESVARGESLFHLDDARIAAAQPDVILTQALCDVCAVSEGDVRRIADVLERAPRVVSLNGTTLDGVWEDVRAVGRAIGRAGEAELLLSSVGERLRAVHETLKAARAPRPRVAVIEWIDPLFAAGHWTPELVRRGGGAANAPQARR